MMGCQGSLQNLIKIINTVKNHSIIIHWSPSCGHLNYGQPCQCFHQYVLFPLWCFCTGMKERGQQDEFDTSGQNSDILNIQRCFSTQQLLLASSFFVTKNKIKFWQEIMLPDVERYCCVIPLVYDWTLAHKKQWFRPLVSYSHSRQCYSMWHKRRGVQRKT